MGWIDGARARWRELFARSGEDARMEEEMRFHIEMETEKNIAAGMSPEEAHRRAKLAFGGVEAHKERMRDGRRVPAIESLLQDLRYAARSLGRTPGFTAAVVLTLAVGIGATTAMYGVMSRLLLLPPPHVAAPERVVKLFFTFQPRGDSAITMSARDYPFFERLLEQSRTLSGVAAYAAMEVAVGSGAGATQAKATVVSRGFWSTLGVRPTVGRLFVDEEARPVQGARVAVLGHGFWRRQFGGDAAVLGRMLEIRGRPYEIIGVAPKGFRGIELKEVDLWLPIAAYADGERDSLTWVTSRGGGRFELVGRLAPGVTAAQSGAELAPIVRAMSNEERRLFGMETLEEMGATVRVTAGPVVGALGSDMKRIPEARVSVWLVGIAVTLLGVACSTVASLLLLRAVRRRREIAVRLALGMGRGRMARQLFTESLLLALIGGLVGLGVALAGQAWINRILLPELAWESAPLDGRMLAVATVCVLSSAFLAGLAPLLQTRFDPASALREGVQHGSVYRSRLQRTLLVAQIALSVTLLVGAGLFLKSLGEIDALDLGLDRDNVLLVTIDFAGSGRNATDVAAFYERALERVQALPGVEKASLSLTAPLRVARGGGRIQLPSGADSIREAQGSPSVNYVTPDFFATAGTRIVQGRDFRPTERYGAPVIVINETMARAGWPGRSPIGECVPFRDQPCQTVIGVVENARKFNLQEPGSLLYYRPLSAEDADERVLLLRIAEGASVGARTVRAALLELDPNLPYLNVETMGAALDPQIRPWRLGAGVFTAFGALAMLLAAVGLYSALAYATTQRTREIGIRVAIGATGRDVLTLVLRDGFRIALVGIGLGMAASLVGGRWIADLLFQVSPRDGLVLASVGTTLLLVVLLASWGPARRAVRVDPTVAMRAE